MDEGTQQILTEYERRLLEKLLRSVLKVGHGYVQIRVVDGKVRFIGAYKEQDINKQLNVIMLE